MTNQPFKLVAVQPSSRERQRFENRVCEEKHYYTKQRTALPDDPNAAKALPAVAKQIMIVHGTSMYLQGIEDGLALMLGADQAKRFMAWCVSKDERVAERLADTPHTVKTTTEVA